jgi:hypothetical protein
VNPQGADLLSQLRDIHAAPAAPWWPPAPGWWFLSAVFFVLVIIGLRRALVAWQRARRRKEIMGWVDTLEREVDPVTAPQAFLSGMNRVFKLVALSAFPEQPCAQLQGEDWAGFIRARIGQTSDLGQLQVLSAGPYEPAPEFDPQAIGRLVRQWIRQHG